VIVSELLLTATRRNSIKPAPISISEDTYIDHRASSQFQPATMVSEDLRSDSSSETSVQAQVKEIYSRILDLCCDEANPDATLDNLRAVQAALADHEVRDELECGWF
jgi:hypothetical protein